MSAEGKRLARTQGGTGEVGAGDVGADGVVLRPMIRHDLTDVLAIERVAFPSPWTLATFAGLLRRENTSLWVAEAERVVGYAVVWVVEDQAELGNLAVAPAWRRKGLGRRLLEVVLDAMAGSGVRELFLEVRESNLNAQGLYGRHGFRQVGRRPGYYSNPKEDALVLRRLFRGS